MSKDDKKPKDDKPERLIAPDRISDVAEWGDRPNLGKSFKDMTAEELAAAEKLAETLERPKIAP